MKWLFFLLLVATCVPLVTRSDMRPGSAPIISPDPNAAVRYVPLGDSIMAITGGAYGVAWRNLLGARLSPSAWPNALSVGPYSTYPGTNNTTALNHFSIPGATFQSVLAGIPAVYDPGSAYDPNVTIIALGANNRAYSASQLDAVLYPTIDAIIARRPSMRFVFVGFYFCGDYAANVVMLNARWTSVYKPHYDALGVRSVLVDPQQAAGPGSGVGASVPDFQVDLLHLASSGQVKMDALVYPALTQLLGM